jgi:L-alanine-DL-glutamate epimerase-like enolase superfamily enzyme
MQITNVEATPVRVPLVPLSEGGIAPYGTNHNEFSAVERVVVRVDTDAGYTGWGEVRVLLSPAATVSIVEDGIAPIVEGQSPFEVEAFRRQVFIEYLNVVPLFAPIEIACWDILGQALERPIYELLGGWSAPSQTQRQRDPTEELDGRGKERHTVDVAYCVGILPPEEMAAKAEDVLEKGYSVLKTKAGRDWQTDVERVRAMDEAVDGQLEFRLDPNQGWTLDQALRVANRLDDHGIYLQYMEQPIRTNMHQELATLRHRTRQPIAPNEDAYIPQNLLQLANAGAMDAAVVDMTPAGGIAGLRQQAAVLDEIGVPSTHHCAFDLGVRTAAIAHAVHGLPGFELPPDCAYAGWDGDVVEEPLEIHDGALVVPDGPGLGVTVDPDRLAEFAIETEGGSGFQ